MDLKNRTALKQAAAQRLQQAQYDPKKLVLIHTGASAALMLVILLAQYVLQGQIDQTGGLSGLGLRSILSTASSSLSFLAQLVLPFWSFGYLFAVLMMAREQRADVSTLLEGFRRFGPVLRLSLTRGLIYMGIAMMCFYPSILIYLFTPLSDALVDVTVPYMDETGMLNTAAMLQMSEETTDAMTMAILPLGAIFAVLFLLFTIPLFYRFRMADFALLDDPKAGAFAALRKSAQMMKSKRMDLFRLDLSFWWYYLLELVTIGICYADVLLPMMGITLPFSREVMFYGFYVAYLLAQLALHWWAKNQVNVTYALVYEGLKPEELPQLPENQGWNY